MAQVYYESTPNPQSMKFVVSETIASESAGFSTVAEAKRSPLATKIFGFPWAAGVFIGPNFVTISKQDWVDWDILADPLAELIKEHVERREPVFSPAPQASVSAAAAASAENSGAGSSARAPASDDSPDDSPIVRQIKQILRDEIRPAVAMDGGDITFSKFEGGRLYLHMHGACSGCPSAAYTLKEGIETRLKASIPEIQEVVSV